MKFSSDRRRVLTAIAGGGLCCVFPQLTFAQPRLPKYCTLDAGFEMSKLRHMASSGNKALDRAMIAEVRKINRVFTIRPGYRFFDDEGQGNALALSRTVIQGTRGTVFFGLSLVKEELKYKFGGAALAGIAAHEGGHIFQFFSSFLHRPERDDSARDMELHADFLAGYYFGRTGRTERSIDVFGKSLFEKGDYDYNDPDHHGTPDERLKAMHQGYRYRHLHLQDAVGKGITHVTS